MAMRSRPKPPSEPLEEHFAKSKAKFLKVLRAQLAENPPRYNPSEAAKVIDYSRSTPYRWAEKDPEFEAEWRDIAEAFADSLEDRMTARAWEGSDVLMIFYLKALRPEKYREQVKHELSGPSGGPIPFVYGDVVAETTRGSGEDSEG